MSELFVAATDGDSKVFLWARETGQFMRALDIAYPVHPMFTTLSFHGLTLVHSGPGSGITLYNVATGESTVLDIRDSIPRAGFVGASQLAIIHFDGATFPGPAQHSAIVCSVYEVKGSDLVWLHRTSLTPVDYYSQLVTSIISGGVCFNQCGDEPTLCFFDCLARETATIDGGALGFAEDTGVRARRAGNTVFLIGREAGPDPGHRRICLRLLRI